MPSIRTNGPGTSWLAGAAATSDVVTRLSATVAAASSTATARNERGPIGAPRRPIGAPPPRRGQALATGPGAAIDRSMIAAAMLTWAARHAVPWRGRLARTARTDE